MQPDKVALVTGGSGAIGLAAAAALAEDGFAVAVIGRDGDRLRQVSAGRFRPYVCDVVEADATRQCAEAVVADLGRLDVLVNCAGATAGIEPADAMTAGAVRRTIDVCLLGTALMSMACIPALKQSRGAIINVSSAIAQRPTPGFAAYAAAKGGVDAFSRALALELGTFGIRVNAVSPSMVRSEFFQTAGIPAETARVMFDQRGKTYPLGRVGEPEDVAAMIAFLASPAAAWITGAVIPVDGGRLIS